MKLVVLHPGSVKVRCFLVSDPFGRMFGAHIFSPSSVSASSDECGIKGLWMETGLLSVLGSSPECGAACVGRLNTHQGPNVET